MKSKCLIKNKALPYRGEPTRASYQKPVIGEGKYIIVIPTVHHPKKAPIPSNKSEKGKRTRTASTAKRQEWTQEKIRKVVQLYNDGYLYSEIGNAVGCSTKMAYMIISKERKNGNVKTMRNDQGWTNEQIKTLVEMYEANEVYADISQAIGKSLSTVSEKLRKLIADGVVEERRDLRCRNR